ncbi:UNVERIFIED_CONTAM: hypothetical protein PYX00_002911 [Menopon gallinae]|uniref:Uncharacterized protein n=1 Tax=Menopon gallinae TaxID=328185 RepID=A0AAW2HZP7_9NEOP
MGTLLIWFNYLSFITFFSDILPFALEINDCNRTVLLFGDYQCNYRVQDIFHSDIRVYGNSSTAVNAVVNTEAEQKKLSWKKNESSPIRLTANRVFVEDVTQLANFSTSEYNKSPGSTRGRYKANLCVEIMSRYLISADSLSLQFTSRNGTHNPVPERPEVFYYNMTVHATNSEKFIPIGCYWHYLLLLATSTSTVQLKVTLYGGDGSQHYAKFYFRIPDWESFNNLKTLDPCLFAPFVYAEERRELQEENIFVTTDNCSKSVVAEIQQKKESSGEISRTIKMNVKGLEFSNASFTASPFFSYYYEAVVINSKESGRSIEFILLPVLVVSVLILSLSLWYGKEFFFLPRSAIIFSKRKPIIFVMYCHNKCFGIYQSQVDILISFLENYCNIIASNNIHQSLESPKQSLLPHDIFDVVIGIPFPGTREHTCTEGCFANYSVRGRYYTVLELPFWSKSIVPFDESISIFKGWKRFKLMEDFFLFLRFLHRRKSFFETRIRCELNTAEMKERLEEFNITNEGFIFCLEENRLSDKAYSVLGTSSFPKLDEMEL